MNLSSQLEIGAVGTSEGVKKAWDTRGRGRSIVEGECDGADCKQSIDITKPTAQGGIPTEMPTIDGIELSMKSNQPGYNIHFDREAMKSMLRRALAQMDSDDSKIRYINTPMGQNTLHYVKVALNPSSPNTGVLQSPGEANIPMRASAKKNGLHKSKKRR